MARKQYKSNGYIVLRWLFCISLIFDTYHTICIQYEICIV